MRKAMLGLLVPLTLLAGCEAKVADGDAGGNGTASLSIGEDGNVAITAHDGVSVSVPGVEAKVQVPGMELDGEHMDIDGMKLYPGTQLKGINVTDRQDEGKSLVEMRFTSPGTPEKLAAYYADAARAHDFADIDVTAKDGGAIFTAKKGDGDDVTITITMTPAKRGTTTGQILIRGRK